VRGVVVVQVKRSATKNAAKSVAATTAASVATLALTGGILGVGVAFTAPAVWCVSTTERLLLVSRESGRTPIVERVLLSAPRGLVRAELKRGLLSQVTLVDVHDESAIARLNVGAKSGAARTIVREQQGAA
jgi:hypothetical protein